jgi:hypothetical protein
MPWRRHTSAVFAPASCSFRDSNQLWIDFGAHVMSTILPIGRAVEISGSSRLLKKPSTGGPSFETLALLAPRGMRFFDGLPHPRIKSGAGSEETRRPVSKGRSLSFQQPAKAAPVRRRPAFHIIVTPAQAEFDSPQAAPMPALSWPGLTGPPSTLRKTPVLTGSPGLAFGSPEDDRRVRKFAVGTGRGARPAADPGFRSRSIRAALAAFH